MKLFKKYILKVYSHTFYPLFFTLYIITSIIYLVKIANLTSIIEVDFYELLKLYSFTIPTILFYTLPITIFISLVITLAKLANEYELIVITSFGLAPWKIIFALMPTLLLSTIFLLTNNLALMPKADYMRKIFIKQKEKEAQFNIKASQYGQQFASWLIYVDKEKDGVYKNVVLYKPHEKVNNIIIAKSATTNNDKSNSSLSLNLKDGRAFQIDKIVSQIDFKKMVINNNINYLQDITTFKDLLDYWKNMAKVDSYMSYFTFSILNALLPILSSFFIIGFGFFNPRYDKNLSVVYAVTTTVVFVILSKELSRKVGYEVLYSFPLIWVFISYIYYKLRVKPYY